MKFPNLPIVALTIVNVAAAAVVLLNMPAHAAPEPETTDVIRTQRIEMIDRSGQVRGQFFVEENGEAILRIRDETGRIRVKLGADSRGSGLVMMDDRTEPAVQMRAGVSALTNRRATSLTLRDGDASTTFAPGS